MKAIVTGGTGFIGGKLVEALVEKGHKVRCLVRKTSNVSRLKATACAVASSVSSSASTPARSYVKRTLPMAQRMLCPSGAHDGNSPPTSVSFRTGTGAPDRFATVTVGGVAPTRTEPRHGKNCQENYFGRLRP